MIETLYNLEMKFTLRCKLTTNKNSSGTFYFKAKFCINLHISFLWVQFLQVVYLRMQVTLSLILIWIGGCDTYWYLFRDVYIDRS